MHLRSEDLYTTIVDGQTVVLDGRSSNYLTVNRAGTVLLEALSTDTSPDELADLLVAEFGIDAQRAHEDCTAFLDQLREHGFLVG